MAYYITGEMIKSAVSIKLGQIFRVATNQTDNKGNIVYTYPRRYKENITNQTFPNFHIVQVSLTATPSGLTNRNRATNVNTQRVTLDYLINVQYRVAQNTETITNLQQQLDEIGLILNTEFNDLDLELPTKVYNKYYEKADGVGQFIFNVSVYATPEQASLIMMQELELNKEV